MDYGKIAYMKMEEIEAKLNSVPSKVLNKLYNFKVTTRPMVDISRTVCKVADIRALSATSSVAMSGKISLTLPTELSGRVDIKVGANVVHSVNYSGVMAVDIPIFLAFDVDELSQPISILASTVASVAEVNLLISGNNIEVRENAGGYAVAEAYNKTLVVYSTNQMIYLDVLGADMAIEKTIEVANGQVFDCVGGEDFRLVYCDECGNMFVNVYDKNFGCVSSYLGEGNDSIALSTYGKRWILFTLNRGVVCYYLLNNVSLGAVNKLNMPSKVVSLGAVRGVDGVIVLGMGDGKNYVRTINEETLFGEKINVYLVASVSYPPKVS